MDGRPNRRNKAVFSKSSVVVWTGLRELQRAMIIHVRSQKIITNQQDTVADACVIKSGFHIASIAAKCSAIIGVSEAFTAVIWKPA